MRKKIFKYAILLLVIVVAVLLISKKWFPSISEIFKPKPVVIDNTPILVKQITDLAQLCTITVFDEVVADSVEIKPQITIASLLPVPGVPQLPLTSRELVLIARGKLTAGTDLKKVQQQQIFVQKDSVSLVLPTAEVLDAIINPSGIEIFSETGIWKDSEITAIKIKARNKMIDRAIKEKLLDKANQRSVMLMENFLRSSGFKKVNVRVG